MFEPALVEAIQNVLKDQMQRQMTLVVRSDQMSEASATGYQFVKEEPPPEEEDPSSNQRIERLLAEQAKMVPGAKLVDFSFSAGTAGQPSRVTATYLVREPWPWKWQF